MADMRCPECGRWNPPQATLCDCGFDFISGVTRDENHAANPPARSSLVKAALYGALGSFLALLPVSVVKNILYFMDRCGDFPPYNREQPIILTYCGVTLLSTRYPTLGIFILTTLLAGAILGTLIAAGFMRLHGARIPDPALRKPTRVFWPAFSTGILFVVIFVFILIYPGQ